MYKTLLFINSLFITQFAATCQKAFITYLGDKQVEFSDTDELLQSEKIIFNASTKTYAINLTAPKVLNSLYCPIILFPGDSLSFALVNGTIEFHANNAIRNNELRCSQMLANLYGNFTYESFNDKDRIPVVDQKYYSEYETRDKEYFKLLHEHLPKPAENNLQRDSLIFDIYRKRVDFITDFKKNNSISQGYFHMLNNILLYRYLYLSINGFEYTIDKNLSPVLKEIITRATTFSDSLLQNINNYWAFLWYYNKYLTTTRLGRKGTDLEQLLNADTSFLGMSRDRVMMEIAFNQMQHQKPNDTLLGHFIAKCNTKAYKDRIIGLAALRGQQNNAFGIITYNGKTDDLHNIFSQCKGYVIYVDCWASWCGPCLNEMKYYDKLFDKYAKENIKFIFLSLDSDKASWIKTSKNFAKYIHNQNSFLLLNSFNSMFAKQYDITSIPRYLLIGKDGKIINDDAPRPSDKALITLLNKSLK